MTYHTVKPCTIDGCNMTINARGLCSGHYLRWQKGQDLYAPKKGEVQKKCTIEDCANKHKSKGLCEMHYRRHERGGDLNTPKRILCPSNDVEERLKFYSEPKPSGCVEWTGSTQRRGYGLVSIGNGKTRGAHIVSWEKANGRALPPGMVIRHKCDNPPCINPAHLTYGTPAENINDMVQRNRQSKGEAIWTAKLTEDDVREIRRLADAGLESQASLARRYGVSVTHMWNVCARRSWKHLD